MMICQLVTYLVDQEIVSPNVTHVRMKNMTTERSVAIKTVLITFHLSLMFNNHVRLMQPLHASLERQSMSITEEQSNRFVYEIHFVVLIIFLGLQRVFSFFH